MAFSIPKIQYLNTSFVGDITSASAVIANIASTTLLSVGMIVTGTGIPANSAILSKTSTTVTLNKNATATTVALALEASFEIVFQYPPVETKGEKIDPKENVSTAVSGLNQVSINFFEGIRAPIFSFLTEALKLSLETFFKTHAGFGRSFRYFDNQNSVSYTDYELSVLKFEPAKVASKGVDVYVWNVPFTFRRVI